MSFFWLLLSAALLLSRGVLSRDERLFSWISVLRFKNADCTSGEYTGICYSYKTCYSDGGTTTDVCALGYGACCVSRLQGTGTRRNNGTYLESPGYPATLNAPRYIVQTIRLSTNVCQVRLDITTIDLAPPSSKGECNDDYLTVSQDTKFNRICGTTNNNHFYLSVDPSQPLTFTTAVGSTNYDRRWSFRVSQICCDQISMAPMGCGQYFTGDSGTAKGLNADGGTTRYYLENLNYAVCFRRELGMCSITYTEDSIFIPKCSDVFDRPESTSVNNNICSPTPPFGASTYISNLLGPHYMYIVTSDSTNDHIGGDGITPLNYNIQYTQNSC